ncbi:MAG: hypothetical protein OEO20_15430 [Gemmatimonadota bacterium]|nr:hypothetical protein [Gemmatimonadota bacterium]MDH3367643.1 hypothetical protein [Gemmatimonadota bacterium]MDH3479687.1 hypothetical protein [Gemmatimonadota bacterium]MDH3569618.1 hypothetical protein [Gemmatimonadota bacterium]MDH5550419.1 hypothetical protein [Gemmatimonadota bacterium]
MPRLLTSVACALLLTVAPLTAQQTEAPSRELVYVAYYQIAYVDLDDWIADYHQYSAPVLQELQDEGVITGWGVWQHQTGVEYNWRLAVRATDWSKFDRFWSEYLGRVQRRAPEVMARGSRMIQAHFDEVWNIDEVHVPDGVTPQYMYDSRFQISFAYLEEWIERWRETVAPVLKQSMEDGILDGWVVQSHNTGGRYNWKVLYLFEEWDDMDDHFGRFMSELTADADGWERFSSMIQAHDDVIWTVVLPAGGN